MLESVVCDLGTETRSWTSLSWLVFHVLIQPGLVIPPLLALIGVPWLIKPLPWKRQFSGFGVVLLLAYLLASSPTLSAVGNQLLVRFLPADSGATADAIVVLGRGAPLRPERVEIAASLWQAKRAPVVFASGRGDADEIHQQLEARGLPDQSVDGEECSRTTEENARYTAAFLESRGVQRILLVTDPPHMLRSLLTFRSFGFEVIPHPSPLPQQINSREKTFLVFREFLGIVSYGIRGRFAPRQIPAVEVATAAIVPHRS